MIITPLMITLYIGDHVLAGLEELLPRLLDSEADYTAVPIYIYNNNNNNNNNNNDPLQKPMKTTSQNYYTSTRIS